ncbi:retinaldehyde dehydrogenase 3-like isoform X2 [Neodiprion pinetum]|uniref:retinaldehyde dehydrogenase 3-like isoform X2 n=1 Tax=Neodiprion pinetum TaxID=441929 RepID=UPI0037226CF8
MNTPKGIPNPKTKYTKIFGSVEPILELETFEEVSRSSDNVYGLSAGVITKNIKITLEYATAIEVNQCNAMTAQTPLGGFKQCGRTRIGKGKVGRCLPSNQNYSDYKTPFNH